MIGTRMRRGVMWGVAMAGLALAGACDGGEATPACGDGEAARVDGAAVCVYRGGISETGFLCPPDMPFAYAGSGFTACASSGALPEGTLDRLAGAPTAPAEPGEVPATDTSGGATTDTTGGATADTTGGAATDTAGGASTDTTGEPTSTRPEANSDEESESEWHGWDEDDEDHDDEDHDDEDHDDDADHDESWGPRGKGLGQAWAPGQQSKQGDD
ncbi:MAG: hypothetical protein H6744_01950 [Deltaproteobacteria bacterium]|nr:hypothetical protein [Deltaproteobacteria bacterium]MCB9785432.1 hypothetical protein [Deltaproteobacteria bacterium]